MRSGGFVADIKDYLLHAYQKYFFAKNQCLQALQLFTAAISFTVQECDATKMP